MRVPSAAVLADLRRQIGALETGGGPPAAPAIAFGLPAIDALLPGGGLSAHALHEIVAAPGDGAAFGFVMALFSRFARGVRRPWILWCRLGREGQESGLPYGPGLARFGLAPEHLILVEAERPAEVLAAMEEGLRCPELAAVLGEGAALPFVAGLRLQRAAETGGVAALWLNRTPPPPACAAVSRWQVQAATAPPEGVEEALSWQLTLWRCRGENKSLPCQWRIGWRAEERSFALQNG